MNSWLRASHFRITTEKYWAKLSVPQKDRFLLPSVGISLTESRVYFLYWALSIKANFTRSLTQNSVYFSVSWITVT